MVIFYMYIMHRYGYQVPISHIIAKPLIASVIMGVVIYYLNLELFISIFVGIIVYFTCILLLKTFDEDDWGILKQLLPEKISNKLGL